MSKSYTIKANANKMAAKRQNTVTESRNSSQNSNKSTGSVGFGSALKNKLGLGKSSVVFDNSEEDGARLSLAKKKVLAMK